MSAIKPVMKVELVMEGNVNGHKFTITGEGQGKPYEGTHTLNLTVTKGGPLPFAYDILSTAFQYGNRVFTKYPEDIPDYFKQTFPEGYSWERTFKYDEGLCTTKSDICLKKGEPDCFQYKIYFEGKNLSPGGPIMQKKTLKWEPSTERMYMDVDKDGAKVLKGDDNAALLLEGGGHYRCDFNSIYKAKKTGSLPAYHWIDHRIEILSHDKDYNKVTMHEFAAARNSPFPMKAPQ